MGKSILDLYICGEKERSSVLSWAENSFISDHYSFSPEELQVLAGSSVFPEDKMDIFISSSIEYLISITSRNIFEKAICRIHYILTRMFHLKIKELGDLTQDIDKIHKVLGIFLLKCSTIKKEILPEGISRFLAGHNSIRLNDILEKTEYGLFADFGLSSDSLYLLHGLNALPELYRKIFSPHLGLFLKIKEENSDYEKFLKSWITPVLNNKSHSDILYLRLFSKNKRYTLENLAVKSHLSRERIRQIIKRSASILSQEKSLELIQPLWEAINMITLLNGFISVSRLAFLINRTFEWENGFSPDCIINLMELNPHLNVIKCDCRNSSECIVYSKQNKCCRCTDIIPVFLGIIAKEKIISSENLAKILYRISSSNCQYCGSHVYSSDFCNYLYLSNKAMMKNIVLPKNLL